MKVRSLSAALTCRESRLLDVPVCAPMPMNAEGPIRTPLYDAHMKLGAHMVNFHGHELPIRYKTIQGEHLACRSAAGLFDVSHMGLFSFEGHGVREWLSSFQRKMSRSSIRIGVATPLLDDSGYIIDDMIFAVSSQEVVYGVPNASMVDVVREWLLQQNPKARRNNYHRPLQSDKYPSPASPRAPEIAKLVFGERGTPDDSGVVTYQTTLGA